MDYIAFGMKVRHYRKKKNLTQEALAEMVDMSASFLGHIERGSRVASLETMMKLCRALDVTPNELLGGDMTAWCADLPEQVTISPAAFMGDVALLLQKQKNVQ